MIKVLKNQLGFSLLQVLVAIGLTGGLSLILMELAGQQNKQQKTAIVNGELTEVFAQFVTMLNNGTSCEATVAGLKKGDPVTEVRYKFDDNEEPFAEVGKPFRGTKLILRSMKLQTDAEYTAANAGKLPPTKDSSGHTTLTLVVELEKPAGIVGGKDVKKTFDIAVAMGQGKLISSGSPSSIVTICRASPTASIISFDTELDCNPNNEACIVGSAPLYFGMCIETAPPTPADDIIIGCVAK
jgi:hypothetical protein